MEDLSIKLLRVIMRDWSWSPYGRECCKFCGVTQGNPAQEKHWEHCPRFVWAMENSDSPKDRAMRTFGKDFPSWENPLIGRKHYGGPYLYNDGGLVLELCAELDGAVYGPHLEAYLELKNVP